MNLTTEIIKHEVHPMYLRHNKHCPYLYENICKCDYWDDVKPKAQRFGLLDLGHTSHVHLLYKVQNEWIECEETGCPIECEETWDMRKLGA